MLIGTLQNFFPGAVKVFLEIKDKKKNDFLKITYVHGCGSSSGSSSSSSYSHIDWTKGLLQCALNFVCVDL